MPMLSPLYLYILNDVSRRHPMFWEWNRMHVLARYDNDIAIPGYGTGCDIRREQAQQEELEKID